MTYTEIYNILRTLPLSYYLKCKQDIRVFLDEYSSKTYVLKEDKYYEIHIGYKMFKEYESELSESQVRALLYHEISHILDDTFNKVEENKNTVSIGHGGIFASDDEFYTVMNIISDERIEQIFKDYYIGVDFKQNKEELIKIDPTSTNVLDHFLWYVRLGYNEELYSSLNDKLNQALKYFYGPDILFLYGDFKELFKERYENDYFENEIIPNKFIVKENRDSDLADFAIQEIRKNLLDNFIEIDETEKLFLNYEEEILAFIQKNKNKFNSMSSYSGKFNTRAVVNDDYRWWTTANRQGQYKQHNKVHLRFIIDNSGSFSNNVTFINNLIKALNNLESKYDMFSYSFATLNTNLVVWDEQDKHKKRFGVCSANDIPVNEVDKYLSSKNKGDVEYYNIVLFDGDAFSVSYIDSEVDKRSMFRVFDRVNTYLIIEYNNYTYTKNFTTANIIVENSNYADALNKNIKKVLNTFLNS